MTDTEYDSAVEIAPGVVRILAENPSPMTGRGTNSYLLGTADLIALDPGPDDPSHLDAIETAAAGRLRYIVVTHCHVDHAPGATALAKRVGVPVLGFGARGDFVPDGELADGDVVKVPGLSLTAIHTPGHCSDHLCYRVTADSDASGLLFSGDHILGGTTTIIPPPDGDMAAYFSSLERLLAQVDSISAIAPGHGPLLEQPRAILEEYLAHRVEREQQVLTALDKLGRSNTEALVGQIYMGYSPFLQKAARRSVWAHLRKLYSEGLVSTDDPDNEESFWSLA